MTATHTAMTLTEIDVYHIAEDLILQCGRTGAILAALSQRRELGEEGDASGVMAWDRIVVAIDRTCGSGGGAKAVH